MSKTALYRHFDNSGLLLYVGISCNAIIRTYSHEKKTPWFEEIATIRIVYFSSREEALREEEIAIIRENPLYNKKSRQSNAPQKDFGLILRVTKQERAELENKARKMKLKLVPFLKRAALLFPIQERSAT
jgi:excinuclease UvrABC nuclease subunit